LNHEPADEEARKTGPVGSTTVGSVAVLGPGGVGGFIAAALARAAPPGTAVTVVASETTAQLITRDGISLRSAVLGEFVARPRAVARLQEAVDLLFIATKAPSLARALARVAAAPQLVVPLLNGIEHMEFLRTRYGADRLAAGSIRIESQQTRPGLIVQTSPQVRVELAADESSAAARLPAVVELLSGAGIPASIEPSEKQVLWSKLVRLNALSATTAAFSQSLGAILQDPDSQDALLSCVREGAAVANADGARIDPEATIAELEASHAALRSSMQRDIEAGRELELDAVQGAVLRAGARLGVPCPTIEALAARIAQRTTAEA
jgi:2-dehydropantoate 2-reductase